MKVQSVFLVLLILPGILHAQYKVTCRDTVEIPKVLYDKYKAAKDGLDNVNQEILKDRGMLECIQRRYLGCEEYPNVMAMRKEAEDALKAAEAKQKASSEAFEEADREVRKIIHDAGKRPVACEYLDRWTGPWGQIVTILFTIEKDEVNMKTLYSPLPDPRRPSLSLY